MNTENIKVGETYYVRVKVKTKGEDYITVTPILQGGVLSTYWPTSFALAESSAFSPIPPENENSEPAPKYDSCRKFRKGDRVRVVENNGRTPTISSVIEDLYKKTFTVIANEDSDNDVLVATPKGNRFIQFYFLELVTPVEELEPYSIDECGFANVVYLRKNGKTYMTIPYAHPVCLFKTEAEALAAAEVERDRLNAEYRKENRHE